MISGKNFVTRIHAERERISIYTNKNCPDRIITTPIGFEKPVFYVDYDHKYESPLSFIDMKFEYFQNKVIVITRLRNKNNICRSHRRFNFEVVIEARTQDWFDKLEAHSSDEEESYW